MSLRYYIYIYDDVLCPTGVGGVWLYSTNIVDYKYPYLPEKKKLRLHMSSLHYQGGAMVRARRGRGSWCQWCGVVCSTWNIERLFVCRMSRGYDLTSDTRPTRSGFGGRVIKCYTVCHDVTVL